MSKSSETVQPTDEIEVTEANLAVLSGAAIAEMGEAEREMFYFLGDMEEWLSTPFVQPSAIAEEGVPFTIYKATRRWAKKVDAKNDDDLVEQCLYYVSIDKDFFYSNKNKETKAFNAGDFAVLALQVNNIREKAHEKICDVLDRTGAEIPNMTLRFVPTRKRGHSPSVTLCHVTAWRPLPNA